MAAAGRLVVSGALLVLIVSAAAAAQSPRQTDGGGGGGGGGGFGTLFSRARFGGRPFGHFGRRLQPSQAVPPPKPASVETEGPSSKEDAPAAAVDGGEPATTSLPVVKSTLAQPRQFTAAAAAAKTTTMATSAPTTGSATRPKAPGVAAVTRSAHTRPKPAETKGSSGGGVGRNDALRGVETGSFVVGGNENYVDKVFELKPDKAANKINTETRLTSAAAGAQHTQKESVREGETAIVHCSFDDMTAQTAGQQPPQIWWTKMPTRASDKPVVMAAGAQVRVPDERLKVVSFPESLFSILIIRGAVAEDSAEYKCSLPTPTGYRTAFAKLEVRESLANQIESSDSQSAVKSGDDLRLFCKPRAGAAAAKATTVWWSAKTADGRTINLAGADDKVWGESLLVTSISKDMEGVYTCYVESGDGGVVKKHFSVNVKERPWPIVAYRQGLKADAQLSKLDRNVAYGDTLSLRCDSGGLPKPRITWFKQGTTTIVADDAKYAISVHEPSYKPNAVVSKLSIAQFAAADAGRYTCVAESEMGVREHSFDVRGSENPF